VIGRIRGELLEATGSVAVVDAGGVGYELQVPDAVLLQLPAIGERVDLYVRTVVREDSLTLYGFLSSEQRRLFDLLTGVNGCGPKTGLALIGQLGEETVTSAIIAADAKILARATGVGPRLAERIIVDLKDKVHEEVLLRKVSSASKPVAAKREDELVDALVALGYRRYEAEVAADKARGQADTVEDQLRLALRELRA
jgi:Holliday junction DNA helicase RuvA